MRLRLGFTPRRNPWMDPISSRGQSRRCKRPNEMSLVLEICGNHFVQRRSAIPCTPRAEIESRTISDFYVGVLSVLAIVLSVVIGMAATVALGKNPVGPDRVLANATGDPGNAD